MTNDTVDLSALYKDLDPMFWKEKRLQTYKYWPFGPDEQCNADAMAAAGFYCVGGSDEVDLVECVICGKQLDGWESTDDPWLEHKKHQANCDFILLNKKDEGSFTVKDLYHLIQSYHKQRNRYELENSIKTIKSDWKESAELIPSIYDSLKKGKNSTD